MRTSIFAAVLVVGLAAAGPAAQDGIAGDWIATFDTPQGAMDADVTFAQDGETLSGRISSVVGESFFKGTIKGRAFKVTLDVQTQNGPMSIQLDGEVDGDTLKGTLDFGQGTANWTGKRKS